MKKFKIKNYIYLRIKNFNINKLIALSISGIIIFCIKYYLNYFGYITDISLIFIFSCALLRSITLVTVESIREPNLNKNNVFNNKIYKNELNISLKYTDLYTKLSNNDNCKSNNNYYKSKYFCYNAINLYDKNYHKNNKFFVKNENI